MLFVLEMFQLEVFISRALMPPAKLRVTNGAKRMGPLLENRILKALLKRV